MVALSKDYATINQMDAAQKVNVEIGKKFNTSLSKVIRFGMGALGRVCFDGATGGQEKNLTEIGTV